MGVSRRRRPAPLDPRALRMPQPVPRCGASEWPSGGEILPGRAQPGAGHPHVAPMFDRPLPRSSPGAWSSPSPLSRVALPRRPRTSATGCSGPSVEGGAVFLVDDIGDAPVSRGRRRLRRKASGDRAGVPVLLCKRTADDGGAIRRTTAMRPFPRRNRVAVDCGTWQTPAGAGLEDDEAVELARRMVRAVIGE